MSISGLPVLSRSWPLLLLLFLPGCSAGSAQTPGPGLTATPALVAGTPGPAESPIPGLTQQYAPPPGELHGALWQRIAEKSSMVGDPFVHSRSDPMNVVELADLYFKAPDYLVHDRALATGEITEEWLLNYFRQRYEDMNSHRVAPPFHIGYEKGNLKQLVQKGFLQLSLRTYQSMIRRSLENPRHTDPLIVKAYLAASRVYFRLGDPVRGLSYIGRGRDIVESPEYDAFRVEHGMTQKQSKGYSVQADLLEGTHYLTLADDVNNARRSNDLFARALANLRYSPDRHQEIEVRLGLAEVQAALFSTSRESYNAAKPHLDKVLAVRSSSLDIQTVDDIIPLLDQGLFAVGNRKVPFFVRIALDKGVSDDKIIRTLLNTAEYWTWTGKRGEALKLYTALLGYPATRQMGYLYARALWGRARLLVAISTDQPPTPARHAQVLSASGLLSQAARILNSEAPSGWLSLQVVFEEGKALELNADYVGAAAKYQAIVDQMPSESSLRQKAEIALAGIQNLAEPKRR